MCYHSHWPKCFIFGIIVWPRTKVLLKTITLNSSLINILGLEEKINTFAQGMETLETRLTQAQQRASEAETKG